MEDLPEHISFPNYDLTTMAFLAFIQCTLLSLMKQGL